MQKKLTREELYELVWLQPMTQIAKGLGISDVMVGKLCKNLGVPRPPRGYWVGITSSKSKHKWIKPPLMPLPSGTETYQEIIEQSYAERTKKLSRRFDWEDLSVEIPTPPEKFILSVNDQVDQYFAKLPRLEDFSSNKELHPVTQKLLFADDQRNQKNYYAGWSKPMFRDEIGSRLIQQFNGFAWIIEALGGSVTSRGKLHIGTHFSLLGHREDFSLNIFDPQPNDSRSYRQKKRGEDLRIVFLNRGNSNWGCIQRGRAAPADFDMSYVRELIREILIKREKGFRDHIFSEYQYCVESRALFIKREEQKRLLEIKREKERIAAIKANRVAQLFDAVERMRKADGIRQLVSRFEEKQASRAKRVQGFDHWSSWALQYANEIDPVNMSEKHLESWCRLPDSNWRPSPYEGAALPTELKRQRCEL